MLIGDMLDVWRIGKEVANPTKWKQRGITAGLLAALITAALSVACAFGYCFDVDGDVVRALAEGIAALLCLFSTGVHITSSSKVGLPAKPDDTGNSEPYANSVGADPEAVKRFIESRQSRSTDQL